MVRLWSCRILAPTQITLIYSTRWAFGLHCKDQLKWKENIYPINTKLWGFILMWNTNSKWERNPPPPSTGSCIHTYKQTHRHKKRKQKQTNSHTKVRLWGFIFMSNTQPTVSKTHFNTDYIRAHGFLYHDQFYNFGFHLTNKKSCHNFAVPTNMV